MVLRLSKFEFLGASVPSVAKFANKSSCPLTGFNTFSVLFKILSARVLNSNSLKSFLSLASSGSWSFIASRSRVMGTSVRMVARNFDMRMSSTAASTFSRSFPLILSEWSRRLSMEPNSLMSLAAVFSPTPGQPGKLSAESPMRARRSMTWAVLETPYFSQTSRGPIFS